MAHERGAFRVGALIALAACGAFGLALTQSALAATTYYTSPGGSGTVCSQTSPCSFTQVFETAGGGSTIVVLPGTYPTVSVPVDGAAVTVEGLPSAPPPIIPFASDTSLVLNLGATVSRLDLESAGGFTFEARGSTVDQLFVSAAADASGDPVCDTPGPSTVIDSVCVDTGSTGSAWGAEVAGSVTISLYNDTFYATQGSLGSQPYAMWLHQTAANGPDTVNATNVIALDGAGGTDVEADSAGSPATINMMNSDYGSSVATLPGAVNNVSGNTGAPPDFVDAAAGDFHELASSFTIGSGLLNATADGSVDFDGLARSVSGKIDMGAFEYQTLGATASASPTTVVVGSPITFTGAATAPNTGAAALTYSWSFDDGASASGAVVSHTFDTPGTHNATLTIGLADGAQISATANVSVSVSPPVPILSNPAVAVLKHKRKHKPATHSENLTFSLNTAASVDLRVVRDLKGKRVRGHCEAQLVRAAKLAPCPKTKMFASGTFSGVSGANTVPIPGGAIGTRPPAGNYTITLTATNTTGTSTPETVTFRVP